MGQFQNTQANKGISSDLEKAKSGGDIIEFALNAMSDNTEGSKMSLHTESGTEQQLNSDYIINSTTYNHVGHVDITPIKKVLFLYNSTKEALAYFERGTVTLIREFTGTERMGFDTKYPISGIGRIRRGTDEVVYWTDGTNPDRYIILNKLDLYLTSGGLFNPDLTLFNQKFIPAQVELTNVYDTGGSFEIGNYVISLRYEDSLGNETETFYSSNPFHAVRGTYIGDNNLIRGGYNKLSANHATRSDAYDPVNKSYQFKFTNVDTTYNKLKIYVTKYTDGNESPVASYLVKDIIIGNRDEITWLFKGIESNNPTIAQSDLIASYARYSTCQAMHHIQNYLIKANLKEEPYDWAKFQKYALTAKVKYVVQDVNEDTNTIAQKVQNYKQPMGVFNNLSAIRGEVQTIGFSVLMKDGTKSPVFIIPGRPSIDAGSTYTVGSTTYDPANHYAVLTDRGNRNDLPVGQSWDLQNLTVSEDYIPLITFGPNTNVDRPLNNATQVSESNAKHTTVAVGQSVPRWKIYNTAINDDVANTEPGYIGSGLMGFYEVDTRYPEIRDSDGDIIFPHTVGGGGAITMDKIRHHQFPDADIAPIHTTSTSTQTYDTAYLTDTAGNHIHPMGVKIFGLVFPPEYTASVEGVQFYYGDRTDDFIIADKGIIWNSYNFRKMGDDYAFSPVGSNGVANRTSAVGYGIENHNHIQYQSPNVQFDNNTWSLASWLKVENRLNVTEPVNGGGGYDRWQHRIFDQPVPLLTGNDQTLPILQYTNRAIVSQEYESFDEQNNYASPEHDSTRYTQKELGLYLAEGSSIPPPTVPKPIPSDPNATAWIMSRDANTTGVNYTDYAGHINYSYNYVSLRTTRDVFDNLSAIIFHSVNGAFMPVASTYEIMGRDCFIGKTSLHCTSANNGPAVGGGTVLHRYAGMYEYWAECGINVTLRHEGDGGATEEIYPVNSNVLNFIDNSSPFWVSGGYEREPQFNQLNPDFSILESLTPNTIFDLNTDWQSENLGRFPVRIAWSSKSQDEELQDKNLVFPALNYDDLSTDRGEIRMLSQKPNMLYAMTDYSIFAKPTNAQGIQLDNSVAFLKSSSFLDIPETELFDTGSGFGGCQHRFSHVHTEFGTIYANQFKGEIYILGKNLTPITNKGLAKRVRDILPSKMAEEFETTMGYRFPLFDSTIHEGGIGIRCYYDPLWKRAIISKVDYEFKAPFGGKYIPGGTVGTIYWDEDNNFFRVNGIQVNPYTDRTNFQLKNLTLSYDLEEQKWSSFHSWIPSCGFNDTSYLYTKPFQHRYWHKHGEHNYLKYYEAKRYPFIIEWNTPNMQKNNVTQVNWLSRCGQWDSVSNKYLNKEEETFTNIMLYTEYHTTGKLDLVNLQDNPFGWTSLTNSQRPIKRYNHIWRVNDLWDMRHVSPDIEPAMTENNAFAPYADKWYDGIAGGFIDKEPNTASYDLTKSRFNTPTVDNEYITTRLWYENQNDNHKLTVDLLSLYKQQDLT